MEMLGDYQLTGHLTSQNSGYSVWGFAQREGRDYFVKQFLSPKYPENDTISSPQRLQKKMEQCAKFEEQKLAIYQRLNANTDGNAVRVTEFFRIGSKYYISMPKIQALTWEVGDVAALEEQEKRRLCSIIAHGIAGLHRGHIIHADLKHDNVLFMRTRSGAVTAKIIDFDSSFLETSPPGPGEDIVGDLVYFSPEACLSIWGTPSKLSCKMDIFSLGVLFHQYFTGELPIFDHEKSDYPGEAVAGGQSLTLAEGVPADLQELFSAMLNGDPDCRPDAEQVFRGFYAREIPSEPEPAPQPMPEPELQMEPGSPFFRAGDL